MSNDLSEIFAICLEKLEQGTMTLDEILAVYPEFRSELEPLLRTVNLIQDNPYQLRAEFKQNSPARLLNKLPDQKKTFSTSRSIQSKKIFTNNPIWAFSAFLGIFCILLLGSGTVYASSNSLPGDILFPVKLSAEDFRLFIANDEKDMQLQTEYLQTRLDEIDQLIEQDRDEDLLLAENYYNETLENATAVFKKNANKEHDDQNEKVNKYQDFLSKQTEIITNLLDSVPEQAQPALQSILDKTKKNKEAIDNLIADETLPDEKEKKPGKTELTAIPIDSTVAINETPEPTKKTNNGNNGNNANNDKDKKSETTPEETPSPTEKVKIRNTNAPTKKNK